MAKDNKFGGGGVGRVSQKGFLFHGEILQHVSFFFFSVCHRSFSSAYNDAAERDANYNPCVGILD